MTLTPQPSVSRRPRWTQVVANATFGVGSVVGKMGLPNMNPVIFATVREIGACVILVCAAHSNHGWQMPTSVDGSLGKAVLCGFVRLSHPQDPGHPCSCCRHALCVRFPFVTQAYVHTLTFPFNLVHTALFPRRW